MPQTKNQTKTVEDLYHRQRDITNSRSTTSIVKEIIYNDGKNTLEFITNVNEFILRLSIDCKSDSENVTQFLKSIFTDNGRIIAPNTPFNLDLNFNEEITKATHNSTECELSVEEIDQTEKEAEEKNTTKAEKDRKETEAEELADQINEILLYRKYKYNSGDKPGGVTNITDITNIEGNDFTIKTHPTGYKSKDFEIEIEDLDQMVDSPLETIIEEQGGGSPSMLKDGGNIALIHKQDSDNDLETIPLSSDSEWRITAPSIYTDWTPIKQQDTSSVSVSATTNTSSTKSSSISARKTRGKSEQLKKAFTAWGMAIIIQSYNLILPETLFRTPLGDLLLNMTDLSAGIMFAYGVFSIVKMSINT